MQSQWHEEGDQNFLVSVSDLMASLIFLFIVTLMIFAFHFESATTQLESAGATRELMLRVIERRLRARDSTMRVEIDVTQGVLRLGERSINFPSGDARPMPEHKERVDLVAETLAEVLPCFLAAHRERCNRDIVDLDTVRYAALLDAVLIEGHTDAVPIAQALRSRYPSNMQLAGARASEILRLMTEHALLLDSLRNDNGLLVLSISGYGERRLVDPAQPAGAVNRRIDLRFLMQPPTRGTEATSLRTSAAAGSESR